MIDSRVPVRSSWWSGMGTVLVEPSIRSCITMWLPRRRTSTNPLSPRIRQTCRPESLSSLPNLEVEVGDIDLSMEALLDL
jgi:hypothetical protein